LNRKAAIDIGTNSVRLLIIDLNETSFNPVFKYQETTRLGAGVDNTGFLSDVSIEKTLHVIKKLIKRALSMGTEDILLIATSAVRNARNGYDFADMVEEFGFKIKILSGEEEAKLGFYGALLGSSFPGEEMLVVDIGGGSTELIFGGNRQIDFLASIDVGAVRLTEKFIKNDPITKKEIDVIRKYVKDNLQKIERNIINEKVHMVGIGGTITTLAAIAQQLTEYKRELVHQFILSKFCVENIVKKLFEMPLQKRRTVPGLQPERADIITAGVVILETIMSFFNSDSITVSEWDNLEGAIYHQFIQCDKFTG